MSTLPTLCIMGKLGLVSKNGDITMRVIRFLHDKQIRPSELQIYTQRIISLDLNFTIDDRLLLENIYLKMCIEYQ